MNRARALTLGAALALLLGGVHWRLAGPSALPADVPEARFSAERAFAVLRDLLREGVPHPVGTPANQIVRDRILARLTALGYQPQVSTAFSCNSRPTCATVQNIMATPPGDGDMVLLTAHYDSVPSGPGASDDGAGVAVLLETARALRHDPARPRIGILITDGEEAGLLGAEAFVARPLARAVRAIVNVEYRGSSGPSYLFETSRGNSGLISAAGRALDRPLASSLFFTIYDLMPNDTDVTVFKRAGMQALNFGAIGNVAVYHTPLDNVANVNLRTLQHHGDNALAIARELARSPLPRPNQNAVYFDVLGFFIVRWRESWTIWIALASLALLISAEYRRASLKGVLLGILAFAGAMFVAALAGAVIGALSHARGELRVAYPQPAIIAAWITGIAATLGVVTVLKRLADARSLAAGIAVAWHLAAITLVFTLPGISYLFLVPAVVISVCTVSRAELWTIAVAGAVIAAILFFPLGVVLYTALGKISLTAVSVVIAFVATTFAPEIATGRRGIIVALVLALIGAVATLLLPQYTTTRPRRAPVVHDLSQPAVVLNGEREGNIVRLRVASTRPVNRVSVRFEPGVEVMNVNGFVPAGNRKSGIVTVYGNIAAIRFHSTEPVTVTATDISYGAPAAVVAKRSIDAVASDRGDVTVSHRTGKF